MRLTDGKMCSNASFGIFSHSSGFTSTQLRAINALNFFDGALRDTSLNNVVILPMLERERWSKQLPRHLAQFPLGNGREGHWTVSSCKSGRSFTYFLRLKMRMFGKLWSLGSNWHVKLFQILNSGHGRFLFPHSVCKEANLYRWAGFLDPKCYEKIDDSDLEIDDQGEHYERFKAPPPYNVDDPTLTQQMKDKIDKLSQKWQWHLWCGYTEPTSGYARDDDYTYGETSLPEQWRPNMNIWISFEILEPLLAPGTGVGDKLTSHHLLATAIVHEICVRHPPAFGDTKLT